MRLIYSKWSYQINEKTGIISVKKYLTNSTYIDLAQQDFNQVRFSS